MIYAKRLKDIREEKEIKLRDIDKLLNFDLDTYSQFEREKTILPIKHLNTLANYFNVSIDYLFEFSNTKDYPNSNNTINTIKSGKRLKEFRKEQNFTQEDLAKKLNVARTIISKYEKGEFLISTHALYDICKKYNISADYLLGKIDEPKYLK